MIPGCAPMAFGAMTRPMSGSNRPIASPCVQVCVIDGESGLCLGCYRTLPEVAAWGRFTNEERVRVMTSLPARRGRIDPAKLGMIAGDAPGV
jgi:predicted Fe-S protein YdhL (DUF1289 family)